MLVKITDQRGNVAYVDNRGEQLGQVEVKGDESLASIIDFNLNHNYHLFQDQHQHIPDELKRHAVIVQGKIHYIHTATDVFLKDYFIPVICPALGYEVEVISK